MGVFPVGGFFRVRDCRSATSLSPALFCAAQKLGPGLTACQRTVAAECLGCPQARNREIFGCGAATWAKCGNPPQGGRGDKPHSLRGTRPKVLSAAAKRCLRTSKKFGGRTPYATVAGPAPGSGRRSGPGHTKRFASPNTTHERSPSSPIRRFTVCGISNANRASTGGYASPAPPSPAGHHRRSASRLRLHRVDA